MRLAVPVMKDENFELRQDLFQNIEPFVIYFGETRLLDVEKAYKRDRVIISPENPLNIIGISGGISHDTKRTDHIDRIGRFIKKGHGTPLEAFQMNFFIGGISKSCGSQVSRYRTGQGHVSQSSRYVNKSETRFVYNIYHNYSSLDMPIKGRYLIDSNRFSEALYWYHNSIDVMSKQDARRFLPMSMATYRHWWINARALRYFCLERLQPDAEWEICRLACLLTYTVLTFRTELIDKQWIQLYEKSLERLKLSVSTQHVNVDDSLFSYQG